LVSDWERIFYRQLWNAGLRPIPQYAEEKFLLDFAVFIDGRKLNIEVDGERYHRNWNGELLRRDQLRNMRMIELGWDVMRFWVYQLRDEMPACVERVKAWKQGTKQN
jgi:very-short-patch-repair endonuclease